MVLEFGANRLTNFSFVKALSQTTSVSMEKKADLKIEHSGFALVVTLGYEI